MKAAMENVRKKNIRHVIMTMWGDDGKECSFYGVLPALYAIRQYADGNFDEQAIARGFEKTFGELENTKPDDYYEKIYLLYVKAYYPEFTLREYGAEAPTLHGFYLAQIEADPQGKLLALFREKCYVGFRSGSRELFFAGNGVERRPVNLGVRHSLQAPSRCGAVCWRQSAFLF